MSLASLFRRWADRLDPPRDPTMHLARQYGLWFHDTQELPRALLKVTARAQLVEVLDPHMGHLIYQKSPEDFRTFCAAEALVLRLEPKLPQSEAISVGLRLWSGAMMGAKLVAHHTRSGTNTARHRREGGLRLLAIVREDRIVRAGVEATAAFKAIRRQRVDYQGLPSELSKLMEGAR